MTLARSVIWGISLLSVLSVMVVYAVPAEKIDVINEKSGHTFSLPANAKALENNPNIFYLGTGVDSATQEIVEGYAIVRYQEPKAKTNVTGNAKAWGGTICYGFLASDAKWKGTPEPWVVNWANTQWLAANDFFTIVNGAVDKWENAADGVMNASYINIFGVGTTTTNTLNAGWALNGINEVVFGSITETWVIAVTTIWGVFGGAPRNRYLSERDQVYDQVDFGRTIGGSPTTMDLENIVTHEMGHSFGMGDLYTSACSQQTMYGYASEGQTNARTLEAGDIAGISKLY